MESNNFDRARKTLQPLLNADPQNAWVHLDLATDIDLGQKKPATPSIVFKNARELRTNPVLQLNLATRPAAGRAPPAPGSGDHSEPVYSFTYVKRMATAGTRWPRRKARWVPRDCRAGGAG